MKSKYILVLFSGFIAFFLGLFSGLFFQEKDHKVDLHIKNRFPVINHHLSEAETPYAFIAGDSHAELVVGRQSVCNLHTVNGGISGARAKNYNEALSHLIFPHKPDIFVLMIGTNDLLRKQNRFYESSPQIFEKEAERLIKDASRLSKRLIVLSIPPISSDLSRFFRVSDFADYKKALKDSCAKHSCEFVDPYDKIRSSAPFLAIEGAMRDGLHLSSYRQAMRRLEDFICTKVQPEQRALIQ